MAKVSTIHLKDWDEGKSSRAGSAVAELMESEGWKFLKEAIEARLRHEQTVLMNNPKPAGDESYDRVIGKWAGLRSVEGMAESVVANGKAAEAAMRKVA